MRLSFGNGWVFKNPAALKSSENRIKRVACEIIGFAWRWPETADSILLYGLDEPIFVIDEYTRRLVKRKITRNLSYDHLQKLFENNLSRDFALYQISTR